MKVLFYFLLILSIVFTSCKYTYYGGNVNQLTQTQVVLSSGNFKVLGSFTGTSTYKKQKVTIRTKEGLYTLAKDDMLNNAKNAGITLIGARTLINITTDYIENPRRITVTYSADIIEFTK
jgi:hypothetical protein